MSSVLSKNKIRNNVSSEKNAQTNLESRHIIYSSWNISFLPGKSDLPFHDARPILLWEQASLDLLRVTCREETFGQNSSHSGVQLLVGSDKPSIRACVSNPRFWTAVGAFASVSQTPPNHCAAVMGRGASAPCLPEWRTHNWRLKDPHSPWRGKTE